MNEIKKVLFTATVDSHIFHFHIPYIKFFKENGYETHVATNSDMNIPYCDCKHKISFERSPFKLNNIKAIKELKKIINKEKFDIIHTHTPMGSVITRIAAINARKKYNTRVIYTAHGFHFFKGAPLLNWTLFYPVEKVLSKYTDTLITMNKEDYTLAKNKLYTKNIEYVDGVGIDMSKFHKKTTAKKLQILRDEIGIDKNDFVMIYVAEITENKNHIMMLKVLSKLVEKYSNTKLLFAGSDTTNGKYERIANEYNLTNNVKFLGYRKDIADLLLLSNISVSTSKREGLPLNLIEARIMGLPIVATNCRGNRDVVENGKSGILVDIDNIDEMEKAIESIIIDKDKFNDMSKNAVKDLEKYDIESVLLKVKKIYDIGV